MAKYLNPIKRVCMLKPMEAEHHVIQLNEGKNLLGRSKETGIRDARCSKRQLELQVDVIDGKIKLKVLGINPCSVNGLMVMQNSECDLEHGDILEMVYGRHSFEVVFKPAPVKEKTNAPTNASSQKQDKEMKAVDNDNSSGSWASIENGKMLVFTSPNVVASEKIAAYDLDGTIIKTKSGNVFPKTIDDWQIIYPEVPGKLKRLHEDNYKICFFTNQAGIATGKVNVDEFKQKIRLILKKLGVPVQVFIAIGDGYYRKPLPGIWEHLREEKNDSVKITLEKCFFVGDAAGRPEVGSGSLKRRKDHSLADRLFALNVGMQFYTPEEHFLNKKPEQWTKPEFEPKSIEKELKLFEPDTITIPATKPEVIIMVGLPGSGKSHFSEKCLESKGYKVVNSDILGSVQNCLKIGERSLNEGLSCVIDNTNVDVESRKKFIDLAKKFKIPCRCFLMNTPLAQIKHNIAFRNLIDSSHSKINAMIVNMLKKRYQDPTLDEGFTEIIKVNFKPEFRSADEEQLYKLYLVEK